MLGILVAIILMSFIYPMFSDFDFNDVSKVNDFSARFIKPMLNIGLVQIAMVNPCLMGFGLVRVIQFLSL